MTERQDKGFKGICKETRSIEVFQYRLAVVTFWNDEEQRGMRSMITRMLLSAVALLSVYFLFAYGPQRFLVKPVSILVGLSVCFWALKGRLLSVVIALCITLLLVTYGPVNVIRAHRYTTPKLMPVVSGYPSQKLLEAYARGEVWLMGCVVSGNEPKWAIVW